MVEAAREVLAGEEAWVVGGAIRDELLGKPVLDLDIACRDPRAAADAYGKRAGGAVFRLSGPHGAWRVAYRDGRTVDFTPLADGIEEDLAGRDFTINAIARPLAGGEELDPFGGHSDLEERLIRAVGETVFRDDPLRLLRAVRLEGQLGFRIDAGTEELIRRDGELVARPAGERILGELGQLSASAYPRLAELGLLEPLGGSLERFDRVADGDTWLLLVGVFGGALERLPISNQLRRYARSMLAAELPVDLSPRAIHRFRRATEPWATDAARLHGGDEELLARARGGARGRSRRAFAPRRRARAPAGAGDRPPARPGGGGAGRGDDLLARRGARASAQRGREMTEMDALHERFSESAPQLAELEESRREAVREHIRRFVDPRGDERVLDLGTGTGALAFAIAPLVREVVGVDAVPEMLEQARQRARGFPNVEFVEGDITRLPEGLGSFDLTACVRTFHHVPRPELVVAELTRTTLPGGYILVIDQLAPVDPLVALELNRFERARDPSHTRALADVDMRHLFESNNLVLLRTEFEREEREITSYLDRAGCEGIARERALAMAPDHERYTVEIGWYLMRKPGIS